MPLVRSFDLSTKKGQEAWVEPVIESNDYRFEIKTKKQGHTRHSLEGTIGRQGGLCIVSKTAMPLTYVREQGKKGNLSQRLMAIVAEGQRGRIYLSPSEAQELIAQKASPDSRPDTLLPNNPRDFKTPNYGMKTYGDLFTDRQLVALSTFSDLVHEVREQIEKDALADGMPSDKTPLRDGGSGAKAYSEAVSAYLGFAVSKCSDYWSSICSWHNSGEKMRNTFGRQAIPMTWDFAEGSPFSSSSGNWMAMVDWTWKALNSLPSGCASAVNNHDAQTVILALTPLFQLTHRTTTTLAMPTYLTFSLPDKTVSRYLSSCLVLATPKAEELVATPYRHGVRVKLKISS